MIVVSWNRAALLRRCLEAIERAEERETLQAIVVDNGSTDGSTELEAEFPNIRFVRLPHNFGLTKAWNIGIRAAGADYLMLLHEDTELAPGTVKELAAVLDARPEVGAVCPLLVDEDGLPAPQIADYPPDGIYDPAEPGDDPIEVDHVKGAALMFRSFFFRAMRMIDEHYGQFGADAELCYRIRTAGKKILIVPEARAVHRGRRDTSEDREVDFRIGVAVFMGKHYGFFMGVKARVRAVLGALFHFRLGQVVPLISGQKIDGSQS
ncbi:MAG: N-acetylglucosaminyl-diphospho-decaprenol L-rhamnosyltransferase [Actinobacteria bacterium ADurb.BinA094]|nr:MAG: N-acetylglucosaminyl-diphospho-decaprenol L-rhamnosyltransferase [Actinobacteria bacterium ADurb.BinA094]